MTERELRRMIEGVRRGKMSRRQFVQCAGRRGLTAPIAGQLLMHAGVANSQTGIPVQADEARRRRRRSRCCGGRARRCSIRTSPSAPRTRTARGSSTSRSPAGMAKATCRPSSPPRSRPPENGGISRRRQDDHMEAEARRQVARRQAVHVGRRACSTGNTRPTRRRRRSRIGSYKDVKVTAVDQYTVRVEFQKPTPFWADAFVGTRGMLIPKHLFEAYRGAKSRDAPNNLKPVGTGPYKFADFTPGDMVKGAINTDYHMPNRPYFDSIEMKGGGDAVSAARAVLQTGEYDYAWNLQVEDEILVRLETGGKGRVNIIPGGDIEFIQLNQADPWTEVDGERSSPKTKHPAFSDPAGPRGDEHFWSTRTPSSNSSTAAPESRHRTSSTTRRASARRTRSSNSTSTRPMRCSKRPAGRRAPTASAKRAARR